MRLARRLALLALVTTVACGSPTRPSSIDVAGSWSGTWQYVTAGITVTDTVTATITESSASASATWTAGGGASGQFTFTPTGSMSGTFLVNQPVLNGQTCSATTSLSGSASPNRLDFTLTAIPASGVCQWATGHHFVLTH